MIGPRDFFRVIAIQRTLIRYGFDEIIFTSPLLKSVHFLLYLLPWNWFRKPLTESRAERLRLAMDELGPVFIKFGQMLSTRRDILPADVVDALAKLQDQVSPFPGREAQRIVETALGMTVHQAFARFDTDPIATASIAQVHGAELHDGQRVVVKIVRPRIRTVIERDLKLMKLLAELAQRYSPQGRRLKPTNVVAEFEKTILDELDLLREAANANQLRRNFQDDPRMVVPEIVWPLSRPNVLVMERIDGIQVDDLDALKAAGIDLKYLAETGVDLFFTQVFKHHFFHADMHPGNLFVLPPDGEHAVRFAPVDFGIMGSLSDFDQRYLAENFTAFLARDYRRVAELHVESGWVPADTRVDEFESGIRTVCEPIFDRPIKDISVGQLLVRLFQTAERFNMEILPQLLLLQKTIVNVEGLGRYLYPDLDLWEASRPSLERFMRERAGVRRLLWAAGRQFPKLVELLPELPQELHHALIRINAGTLKVQARDEMLESLRDEVRVVHRRLSSAIAGLALLAGAAALTAGQVSVAERAAALDGLSWPVWVFAIAGLGLLGSALLRR